MYNLNYCGLQNPNKVGNTRAYYRSEKNYSTRGAADACLSNEKKRNTKPYEYKPINRYVINKRKKDEKKYKGIVYATPSTKIHRRKMPENRTYDFQKRLYTSYSKFTEVKLVTIGIASPLRILQWAEKTLPNGKIYGEVLNANTLHHKTFKPQKGGLFCERIFGPLKDFQCACGKIDKTAKYSLRETEQKSPVVPLEKEESKTTHLEENISKEDQPDTPAFRNADKKSLGELSLGLNKKTTRKLRKFCPDCDVEYTWSVIRRYQLGYIKLISPVTHVWFLKGTPSYLSILLDIKKRHLQSITYCSETFTIEHSESAASVQSPGGISTSAFLNSQISGFDLDSPSKIYASWLKAKNMGANGGSTDGLSTLAKPTKKDSSNSTMLSNNILSTSDFDIGDHESLNTEFSDPNLTSQRKKIYLDYKTKRINTINNWKKTQSQSVLEKNKSGHPHYSQENKTSFSQENWKLNQHENNGTNFYINKTPQLLNLFQKPKNLPRDNRVYKSEGTLYQDILTELGVVDTEISYFVLQFIFILQLGFIYNNFIQSLFSENIFNLETFLIQKKLYEQQTIDIDLVDSVAKLKGQSVEKSLDFSYPNLIQKINKKSPINFYIKAYLQRMLHKKIIMYSIVKTWQNVYKKSYLKAMYKITSYFYQTQPFVLKKHEESLDKKQEYPRLDTQKFFMASAFPFFHYYKIHKIYGNTASLNYSKKILQLFKKFFKKNVLLTLQNIKQPIFSLQYQNTKNFTLKTIVLDTDKNKFPTAHHEGTLYGDNYNKTKTNRFRTFSTICYTDIPIPYSISQLMLKKSEEITDLLSLDLLSLVDLLSKSGFTVPLVVGKFFEQTRYLGVLGGTGEILSSRASSDTIKESNFINSHPEIKRTNSSFLTNTQTQLLKNQRIEYLNKMESLNNRNLNYKIRLVKLVKNLFSRHLDSNILRVYLNKHGGSGLKSDFSNNTAFSASKRESVKFSKIEFSKLFPYKFFKQPYSDFYYLNNGKYSSVMREPGVARKQIGNNSSLSQTFSTEKNNPIKQNKNPESLQNKNFTGPSVFRNTETYSTPTKRLYNNVYTLSHRERWGSRVNEGKDWQIFLLYNTSFSNSKDFPIFAYQHRISPTVLNPGYISRLPSRGLAGNLDSFPAQTPSFSQSKQPYAINNSFFSGPGIIQQLLNELTFTEMKKLDKQNRLLLYLLNKSIFKLKKHIKIFVYDKASQIEMRELCKKRDLLIRRTKLVRKLFRKDSHPSSMILTVLPVLPPDLRPIVKMGGQIAASDLNRFYQRVIYRNDRLKKFLKDPATSHSYEMKYAQRLLQEAVDNLIQNSQTGGEKDARGRALKSLSDILKGKQGRFRQFLLGKRVDYSGRSVIVVGPKLKLYECGIPLEMALELYLPFLLKILLNKNYAKTVVGAKALIKNNRPLAFELLREIMQVSPVLLNRAPTLHRLGFQAFVPKLVEGRAILLHPLVCSSFNADFDGDQMAVHLPITIEARAEAWKLMLSRNNMLSPATGDPLSIPSQDMVLGCYYLTTNSNKATLSLLRGSGLFFTDLQKVLYAYDLQIIDLHALVWVRWAGAIENGTDQEEPLEIRVSSLGSWQELSYNYIRHFDSTSQLLNQYMSTTPGRILFYSLLQNL